MLSSRGRSGLAGIGTAIIHASNQPKLESTLIPRKKAGIQIKVKPPPRYTNSTLSNTSKLQTALDEKEQKEKQLLKEAELRERKLAKLTKTKAETPIVENKPMSHNDFKSFLDG